jgi:peptidyl-prolyl cis-trans isomerase B (cyclophilin B)
MRRILTITGATAALGLAGLVAASVTQAAPRHPGAPRQHAARVAVLPRTGVPRSVGSVRPDQNNCGYHLTIPADRFQGLPDFTPAKAAQPYDAVLHTTQGTIVFSANTTAAPCTTYSFRFLAQGGYFSGTHCHRLTVQFIYVLQCGDPTGTGSGGPGYSFNDENLAGATYPAGTVAMANAGPNTNGSQFFITWKDTTLSPNYTPFGTVIAGMNVLQKIAAAGDDQQNGPGDGYPTLFTGFHHVQIQLTSGG